MADLKSSRSKLAKRNKTTAVDGSAGDGVPERDKDFQRYIDRHLRDWERRNGETAVQFALQIMAADAEVSAAVRRAVSELLALDKEQQREEFDEKVDSVVQSVPAPVHQQIKAFIAQLDSSRRAASGSRKA